jgi:hypothetical protein
MGLNNKIRNFLLEIAGISFEVRKWVQVIENYVKDYVAKEREKIKAQQPKVEPKKDFSWSYNDDHDEDEFQTDYTHFENYGGDKYASAKVYSFDLYINPDVLGEYPKIKEVMGDKLFEVELDGEGEFSVDAVGSSFPDNYLYGILEIIKDHMVMGEAFYTDDYEEVFAVIGDIEDNNNYNYYMNEDNNWSGLGNYSYTPQPKIDSIEINGKDFPDAYEDFKVDKWVITNSNRIEYDHRKSGYDKDGNYVVYLNMPMLSIGGSALVHEIKHAYDDWNRMSKGAPPIRAGWEIKNIYTPDFEKLILGGSFKLNPMLHPIIRYYYLGSKLETPAYLENEYDNTYMTGSYRDTAKKMMNFKASNFLNKKGQPAKGLQESWTELITNYDIPFFRKFKNVVDFLKYTEKHFNKRGRNILKRIDKMRYVHDRPQPKYEPRVYTKPTEVEPKKEMSKSDPKESSLNAEIDKLEAEWDDIYEVYLENKDPKLREKLSELDKIIKKKIGQLNNISGDNLPF